MKVLLAGGSGALGLPIVRSLRAGGHDVFAIHREPESADRLAMEGAIAIPADALDRDSVLRATDGYCVDAVINELTSLRKTPMKHRDMSVTDRLRTIGTRNLLAVARQTGAMRFITQSFALGYGYGNWGDRVLSEADPFAPPGNGRFEQHLAAMRSNEEQVLHSSDLDGIALRYGLLYGPGPASDAIVDGLRRHRLPVVRNAHVEPWVYIDDAASATVAALERGEPGNAYNIVDDEPVSLPDLVEAIAAAIHVSKPRSVPRFLLAAAPYARAVIEGGLRVSNAKVKRELQWMPDVPSYHDGVPRLADRYLRTVD